MANSSCRLRDDELEAYNLSKNDGCFTYNFPLPWFESNIIISIIVGVGFLDIVK